MNKNIFIIALSISFILINCSKDEEDFVYFEDCDCFIDTSQDSYNYPVRPGSEIWNSFTTTQQMIDTTQVPFDVLDAMSTLGVFESCAENPSLFDLYISLEPQKFFDYYRSTFNACKELFSRNDAASEIIKRYILMCPSCVNHNYSSHSGKGAGIKDAFVAIELFLAQPEILSLATDIELVNLATHCYKVYKYKNDKIDSLFFRLLTVWLASRIMDNSGFLLIQRCFLKTMILIFLIKLA